MRQRKAIPGDMPGRTMRFSRSVRAASAAAILAGALLAGGGAASASAATAGHAAAGAANTSAAATAGVTWHRLSLINGWASAGSDGTGYPSWAVKGGVVYLSGSLRQVSGSMVEPFLLPKAARPAHLIEIPVYTYGDTNGWLEIYPTGDVYANANPYSNAQSFTSLAGISFPAASATTNKLSLINGWRRSHGYWDTAPSYTLGGGMVYLTGALHQPSGTSLTFSVLPKAARPRQNEYIIVSTTNGTTEVPGVLWISASGRAELYDGGARTRSWLGGVAYPQVGVTSHKLALVNGWTSAASRWSTGDPAYSVSGGVVHISGSLIQHTPGAETFATLPAGARPKHSLYIKVYTYGGSVGTLYIQPNGTMQAYSPITSEAQKFTSLAAISFPLGS